MVMDHGCVLHESSDLTEQHDLQLFAYLRQELIFFIHTSKGPNLLDGDDFAIAEMASVYLDPPSNANEVFARESPGCLLQLHVDEPENNAGEWTTFAQAN